jgi:hypothetical protein
MGALLHIGTVALIVGFALRLFLLLLCLPLFADLLELYGIKLAYRRQVEELPRWASRGQQWLASASEAIQCSGNTTNGAAPTRAQVLG